MFHTIRKLIRYDTLSGRLRFWNIFLILLVSIVTIVPAAIIDYHHIQMNAHRQLEHTMVLQRAFIQSWLDERSSTIRNVANLISSRTLDLERMKTNLLSFQENQHEFTNLVFVNEQGKTQIDTHSKPGVDVSDLPYFQAAQAGREYITGAFIGKDSGSPIMIFSAPILDKENHFLGLIYGTVNISSIDKLFTQFQTGHTGETYLLNEKGLMLTESRFSKQLIKMGKVKQTTRLQFRVDSQIYQEALEDKQSDERATTSYVNYLGEYVYGQYSWMNNHKLLLVGEIQQSEVLAPYYTKLFEMISSVLLILLFGGFVLFTFTERLKKMLFNLQLGVQHLQEGRSSRSLPPVEWKHTPIEIKELFQAFDQMASTIQHKFSLIKESEARYRQLVELSPKAIIVHVDDRIILANQMAAAVLKVASPDELLYKSFLEFIHPEQVEQAKEIISELCVTKHQQLKPFVCKLVRGDQQVIDVEVAVSYITFGKRRAFIMMLNDVTEHIEEELRLHEENQLLQQLSQQDSLVGIANRRMFEMRFEDLWNQAWEAKWPLSLIMLDIDFFKEYNDTYGHQMGDLCLKKVGQRLEVVVRQAGGFLARYGGEEFVIILPYTDRETAFHHALNLRIAIVELGITHKAAQPNQIVTISLGVSTMIPTPDLQRTELLHQADKALYAAKKKGRNRVILYNS